jgi:hypothetical protein
MKTLYSILISTMLLISSNTFAKNSGYINGFLMPIDDEAYEIIMRFKGEAQKTMAFSVWCIDGYQYLFTYSNTIQMKENHDGKSRPIECREPSLTY